MTKDDARPSVVSRCMLRCRSSQGRGRHDRTVVPWRPDVGREKVKALVLAAGPGRRLEPLTDELPKTLLPLERRRNDPRPRPRRTCARSGVEEVVVVTGFAAERVEELRAGARAPPRRAARAGLQRARGGVEQRVLALARARGLRATARCSSTATPCTRRASRTTLLAARGDGVAARRRPGRSRSASEEMKVAARRRTARSRGSARRSTRRGRRRVHRRRPHRAGRGRGRSRTRSRRPGGATPRSTTRTASRSSSTRGGTVRTAPIGSRRLGGGRRRRRPRARHGRSHARY